LVFAGGSDRHAPSGGQHWRTYTFNGLTLRYPPGWHAVRPDLDANTLGGTPLGTVFGSNATVVSANQSDGQPLSHPTTTISGWPAIVRREKRCGQGGTYGISASLFVLDDQSIDVSACTASTDPADRHVLDRIISTLRYAEPSGITISGRLLREGGPEPGPPVALPGLVTLEPVGKGPAVVIQVGDDGRYSAQVLPGRYTITGNSPRIQGGAATCGTVPTPVTARHSVTVDVICSIN
jgi:hypothetical protein